MRDFCRLHTLFYTSPEIFDTEKIALYPVKPVDMEHTPTRAEQWKNFAKRQLNVCWISSLVGVNQDQPIMVFE